MTPIFIAKRSHRIKEQPLIRASFAIPEGALFSGFQLFLTSHVVLHCVKRSCISVAGLSHLLRHIGTEP